MDRITSILAQNAPQPDPMMEWANAQSPAMYAQQPQALPLDQLKQKIAQGDPPSLELFRKVSTMVGNDPQAQEQALQALIDHPDEIDPNNSYQVYRALGQWSKQSGYSEKVTSPQRMTNEQLAMQDMANIASGKGTDFYGRRQEDDKNLALIGKYAAVGSGGAGGGVTGFVYNKMRSALEAAGVEITPDMELQLVNVARNGLQKGATINVNGQQIAVENLVGTEDMLAAQAAASQQGEKGVDAIMNPIIKKGEKDAELQAGREDTAAKKGVSATNSNDMIVEARKWLPKATGSYLGTIGAVGKRVAGYSDETTQANTRLKSIAGWLTANVPRMEGPQSNFDVQIYQQMAAQVGDTTIPIEDRLAALNTLEEINNKYAGLNSGGGSSPQGNQGEVNFNDLPD